MDYKEKYELALERASKIHNETEFNYEKGMMEEIFPELKESEDERIRKEIMQLIQGMHDADPRKERWLGWLEKQGERKETLCAKCRKAQPSHSCQDITALGRCYIEGINKSNKVEPKFKVGDWIVNKGHSYLIADIDYLEHRYLFEIGGYTHEQLNWEYIELADKRYHLWTLEDAKEGDVLYSSCCGELWIFEDEKKCHVGYNPNYNSGYIVIDKPIRIPTDVQPATKEQRNLLFQKMKEAGYEWDEGNKELKLLITNGGDFFESDNYEQKPAWSEEDEIGWTNTMIMIKEVASKHYTKDSIKLVIDWLNSLKERIGG